MRRAELTNRSGADGGRSGDMPLLRLAFAHLKAYEARARAWSR
jgi:hypothetical protein